MTRVACVLGLLALTLGAGDMCVGAQQPDIGSARPWAEAPPSAAHVVIIDLEGTVTFGLAAAIKRQTNEALSLKPDLIIYRIDTYGGTADSALEIAGVIGGVDEPTTVAYIPENKKAISAGALIAMSCRQLVMGDGSKIGDCQPIVPTAEGITPAG